MIDPHGPQDALLIARALAQGDQHAFATLVRRHQGGVRALLRRLCNGDLALADDLAQETFLQAWRKLAQFRAEARFATWLYRVAYNAFLQHCRARPQEQVLVEPDEMAERPGDGEGDDTGEARQQLSWDLERSLTMLSPAEKAAILYCYYLDLSHEEAAYALGCPLGTLKSHLSRARQKLKTSLKGWEAHTA